MDENFTLAEENFEEFNDVLSFLDSLKEKASAAAVHNILDFARACRMLPSQKGTTGEIMIN